MRIIYKTGFKVIFTFISLTSLYAIELLPITIESSKLNHTALDSSKSIDIIDKDKIDILNIKSIQELSSVISNTNISGIGSKSNKTLSFRGICNYVTYESSVAVYIDDIPLPFSYGYGAIDFTNVKSIEVLKGPQGTEFGKSTQSGVINIYTKEVTKEFKSSASVGYGSYNTKEFYGDASGSTFNKNITYRVAITKNSTHGYSKNELSGNNFDTGDFLGISAKLRYNPNIPLDISLNYIKSKSDDGGSPFKINTKENPYSINNEPTDDYVKMDNDLFSVIVKYKRDDYTFTSTSTYAKESILKNDYVGILGGLLLDYDIEIEEITQELRLNYNFESIDFLIGAFYSDKFKFDYKENQTLFALNLSSLNDVHNPDKNIALFIQAKYYINDNYSVMAGIRYQQDKRSFSHDVNNFGDSTIFASSATTWSHILPTLSLSYYQDDNSHTYLTYSKGYRAGGYNYRTVDLVPFAPEVTNSLELGHKKVYNSSLSINSALFYTITNNQSTNVFDDNLATTTIKADQTYSYGAEFDLKYKTDTLNLYATLGVTKAKYKKFSTNKSDEGNNIIDVPDTTASIGAKYSIDTNYYLQSDIRYMGKRYYNISNSAKESGYSTVNLGVGYNKKNWNLLVYANNLFDARYVDFMIYTPSNNYYHFGVPRVVGIKLSKSF